MCFCCAQRTPPSSFGVWLDCSGPVHPQHLIHLSPRSIGSGATAWRKRVPDLLGDLPCAVRLSSVDVHTLVVPFNGLGSSARYASGRVPPSDFAILLRSRMLANARKLKEDALEPASVSSNRLSESWGPGELDSPA